jgi:ribonucleotide reductase beta subunit family protein with ferritin-like domain
MAENKPLLITDDYEGYETRYPDLLTISNEQFEKQIWYASEILVEEEDRLEMLYKLDARQQEVVKRILPIFRKYEIDVSRFWTNVYPNFFKAPECIEGSAVINVIELATHARFYDKINKVFGTDTDEHYLSYLDDPTFKERAKWLGTTLQDKDLKKVCLVYGMVEGVILFSLFALLRSFQANGYNLIATTVKGTKQSAMDELLHSRYLTKSFNYYYKELNQSFEDDKEYLNILLNECHNLVEMEIFILKQVLGVKEGDNLDEVEFNSIKLSSYIDLVKVLANDYFIRLGAKTLPFPEVNECELHSWFVTQTVAYAEPDFFSKGKSKEYESSWNKEGFIKCWRKK